MYRFGFLFLLSWLYFPRLIKDPSTIKSLNPFLLISQTDLQSFAKFKTKHDFKHFTVWHCNWTRKLWL